MKIIYFTTACEKEDYISFSKNWNTSLNTSIQNLHNRLIRSLALTHEVEVISIRPFSKKYCQLRGLPSALTNEGKITWHYLEIKRHKVARFLSAKRQAKKLLSKMNLKDCIIITDTLNPYILNSSTSLAKKYHLPIMAAIDKNTDYGQDLEDMKTGFWCCNGDIKTYKEKFNKLIKNEKLRIKMGNNGYECLRKHFNVENSVKLLEKQVKNGGK